MTADILTLARETLALADGATPGEWRAGEVDRKRIFFPDPDSLAGPYMESVVALTNEHFDAPRDFANARFIAHGRTAAPELARFVERVDQVLRAFAEELRDRGPTGIAVAGAVTEIRQRLGLDTTEGGR